MRTMFDYFLDDEGLIPPMERMSIDDYDMRQPKLNDREDVFASAKTARLMNELGANIAVTEDDEHHAQELFTSARTPTKYERQLPGVMLKLEALLTQYDHMIIDDAQRLRTYVTNRLLEETEDDDPKIRLRAYELLGKITDVGLFTERKEVTVKHQTDDELKNVLKAKLDKLIHSRSGEIQDAQIIDHETQKATEKAKTIKAEDLLDSI